MAPEEHVPYFLVSHVRGDDDAYVEELFRDLRHAVGELTGQTRSADIGELARDLDPDATAWPAATADALARCQVFLPLCSARSLLNESAGRHWWIFRERLRRFRDEGGAEAPSLLPLRWTAVRDLSAGFPEFVPADPAEPRRPLGQYLRLRSLRPQYRAFVHRLAQRIVRTARAHPLGEYWPLPAPARTPNAFADAGSGAPDRLTRGTRNVRFVVAAGSRDDMEQVRSVLDYYGKESADWAPYLPVYSRPLAEQAKAVAAERLFGSEVTDLKDLRRTLDLAREARDLVVLLLDPWATRLPDSRRRLSDADGAGLPDAALLVPLSGADEESERSREELLFDVEQTLSQFLDRSDALYSGRLPTPDSFGGQLAAALEEGRNRMFRSGRKVPPSGTGGDRPILRGP
ncbi:FxsC protein [Pseudosporangium ferrugineum]|uniref:FxsC-like protein n=1 Tax=Pseudosporangium ferrugineum TaxID=439699 RepID=A0A2T0S7A8_9ACTN|nr:FxsC protein [Pseudosporangium ferrugineum]PRY29308.1 FxsC-like protein [Pseudosporangium ferrugineum]